MEGLFYALRGKYIGDLKGSLSILLRKMRKIYVRANTIRGAVENALDEWYRCNIVEYEEKKRLENGEV